MACYNAARKTIRPHNWNGGRFVPAVCRQCGVDFQASRFDVAKGYGKFCGRPCYERWRASHVPPVSHARGGKRSDLGDRYFRSRWEANWARYLNWLQQVGEIRGWEYEPHEFEFAGVKRGNRFYLPDFRVVNKDGSVEYHEVKGYMDSRSQTKLKRMAKYHPDVKVVLIDEAAYRNIAHELADRLPGWE